MAACLVLLLGAALIAVLISANNAWEDIHRDSDDEK